MHHIERYMKYDKLVRDRIVEIIEAKGETATWHVADDAEYRAKLGEKFREEVGEFLEAESSDEMADVFEVITAWLALKGWTIDGIVKIQEEKRVKRGSFDQRIILDV